MSSFHGTETKGIRAYRRAALVLAGSSFLALPVHAADVAADSDEAVAAADGADTAPADRGEVVVTGRRDKINSLNSKIGDIRDAPQSVSVIPREVIEQQAATTLSDVLRNVSGISMAAGEGGVPAGDNLTLRGFSARTDIFVDGIRDLGSHTRDTFNVEQVEVVKGPSSVQTGRGSTGGYINLISKQPQRQSFVSGTVGVGSPEFWRGAVDMNIAEDQTGIGGAAFRLNMMYQKADTPGRDHVEGKRWGFAPSVALGLGSSTRAILSYQFVGQDNVPDYGIPIVPDTGTPPPGFEDQIGRPAKVDRSNYYGMLDRDYEKTKSHVLTFAFEHDFSDTMRIANITRYGHARRDSVYSSPRFNAAGQIRAQPQSRDTRDTLLLNQTNVYAKLDTGGIVHDLIAGFELSRETSRNRGRTFSPSPSPSESTDPYDPIPNRPYTGTIAYSGYTARAKARSWAVYLFDTITISPKWLITGGIRYDRFSADLVPLPSTAEPCPSPALGCPEQERTDKILSWRAGITYKPIPSLSIYAGAGSSANPSFEGLTSQTFNSSASNLKPEKTQTFEIGAKWDGFDGRLLLTGALFRIDKTNVRIPEVAGGSVLVLDGKQRVDGFELGATGRITKNWELIAAYAYLDSEIRDSNTPAEVGKRLLNTPKHSFSVWSTYKLPVGVELGGGARYVSSRFANNINTRKVSGYWTADVTAAYDFTEKLALRVNILNLFDKRYFDRVGGGHAVPGAGRSAIATLAFKM